MVAPDTMNDLGMADSEELVEVFGFSGDRVELPEEAVIPYTFGQAASLSSSDLHRFRTHNTSICLLYTSPSPRDRTRSRMPSSA